MTDVISSSNGLDRISLAQLGVLGEIGWSHARPTGCLTAGWSLTLPITSNHPALAAGRRIELYEGLQRVWSGVLSDPERGTPWTFEAQGYASLAVNYAALDGSGNTTSNPNTAVDAAITRGLPWVRNQTLPTPTLTSSPAGSLADLLNQVAAASGMRWQVDADRTITMTADTTTVTLLITAASTPGGRSVQEYATALYGRYMSNAFLPAAPAMAASTLNPAGNTGLGRREKIVDLTPAGPMSSSTAVALLDARFPLIRATADFTGNITVQYGDVLTLGGRPVNLNSLTAGLRARIIGAAVDPILGELYASTSVEIILGQVDLDASGDTATITPLGADQRNLSDLLEVAAAPDTYTVDPAA